MTEDKFMMWNKERYTTLDANTIGRMLVCRRCGVVIAQLDVNIPDCPVCELKKRFLNFVGDSVRLKEELQRQKDLQKEIKKKGKDSLKAWVEGKDGEE